MFYFYNSGVVFICDKAKAQNKSHIIISGSGCAADKILV